VLLFYIKGKAFAFELYAKDISILFIKGMQILFGIFFFLIVGDTYFI
jgi:hypothetical protein